MKSSVLVILTMLLTMAILAPSVIMFVNIDEKAITFDFNEEEKKEVNDKEFFLDSSFQTLRQQQIKENNSLINFYLERTYQTSLFVFLPPPRTTI